MSADRTQTHPTPGEQPKRVSADRAAWYVYGVLRRHDSAAAEDLVGQWGQQVEVLQQGELAAVVSRVPRDEFDESALRAHLADMSWVESVARAHEGVLDRLCRRTTVIPMRMCTVYSAEDGVRKMLEREASSLDEAIDHLAGRREWGVQAFFSRSRATAQSAGADDDGDRDEVSTGAAYLKRRREERDLDERLDAQVEGAVQEIHELLAKIAVDSATNSPQSREASGHDGDMVLNGVYLVADEDQEAFEEQVRVFDSRYEEQGLELSITGPWPPYNFLPGSIGATW